MSPLLAALALLPLQAEPLRVSVDSRGDDVREVIATLFAQAHRPYALDAAIKGRLYVTLVRMPFPKALSVILKQASLVARDQDGVTMIAPAPKAVAPVVPTPVVAIAKKAATPVVVPKVPASTFARRVSTRLSRAPLAEVFAAFGEQAGVEIAVDPSVPPYRVDAFFAKTSLRYALDRVCKAAGLTYAVGGGKIVVR